MTAPDCQLCGDSGWITRADADDYAWDIPCPEGCPAAVQHLDASDVYDGEVPF